MSRTIVECVPNFSEGRDAAKVDAIVAAIRSTPGAVILDRTMDADHNRSVITFAAPAELVGEAAIRGVAKAVELIDLNFHTGVHPRIGAADVVPFVPVEGVTLADCVGIAQHVGAELWRRLCLPVYLYEAAARQPDRVNLENIRKRQFEGLREEVRVNPARRPDFGDGELHPTAGATVVGARKFLIAYNINLDTADVAIARRIAKTIRFSSGGLPCVKAMGVPLASRNLAQVSMNLTDFERTPVHTVFDAVRAEAARYGVAIVGSEIIGLIPNQAIAMSAAWYLQVEGFHPNVILENRLAQEATPAGLDEFLDAVAAPTATPGGGSAAAAAGAMAAALGSMIAGLARLDTSAFEADRQFFSAAVERDAKAYEKVVAAHRIPLADRGDAAELAMQEAARVPMEVAEEASDLQERLRALDANAPDYFRSDIETAAALAQACVTGALANVRINVAAMQDTAMAADFRRRMERVSALAKPSQPGG